MADARLRRALFTVALAGTAVLAASCAGAGASSIAVRTGGRSTRHLPVARARATFPCRWRFDLEAGPERGLRDGRQQRRRVVEKLTASLRDGQHTTTGPMKRVTVRDRRRRRALALEPPRGARCVRAP
jgi:hypothetical protein